ncbi:hypothetical protein B0H13DRAFT_1880376 [Mycena leptocephala]|nr:hypothetical protein B0H13DRAFT_1880376 [Mycena leptocephala]
MKHMHCMRSNQLPYLRVFLRDSVIEILGARPEATLKTRRAQDKLRTKHTREQKIRLETNKFQRHAASTAGYFEALRDYEPEYGPMDEDDGQEIRVNDILNGRTEIDISHAGGEFQGAIHQEIEEEGRRQQIGRRTRAFEAQMDAMVEMFIHWVGEGEPAPLREDNGGYPIRMVDILGTFPLRSL